tara:strand:+ start:272 stop:670 length:399 start_codon:yes stop_codon:yes gene_type:complete
MSRGRPSEQVERLDKWTIDSTDSTGTRSIIKFNRSKSANGPYSFENSSPKGYHHPKVKPERNKSYGNQPVVMIFNTSNRSNAKTKMKVWNNENIDYIISTPKLVGVPSKAVILELGVGKSIIERYSKKYNLT